MSRFLQENLVPIRTFHLWVLEPFSQTSGQDRARHDNIQIHPQGRTEDKSH
jgi:hypothetical protein